MATKTYNGYKNWNHWNVSLWINNDEGLYNMARDYVRSCKTRRIAAAQVMEALHEIGVTRTPDGAPYSVTTIMHAMQGME